MRKQIFITSLVLVIGMVSFCGESTKKDQTDKPSESQQLVGGLLGGSTGESILDTKIRAIKTALDMYYTDNNEYPEMLEDLVPEYMKTKTALLDPWGTPFELESNDEMNLEIISAGKDKTFDNADDVKRRI